MISEIKHLQDILSSFLGEPKNDMSNSGQLEYPCPMCKNEIGEQENYRYHLNVNLYKQRFHCFRCSANDNNEMHGSIIKLIKKFGNTKLLEEYKDTIKSIKESKYYSLQFSDDDFRIDQAFKDELVLPENFQKIANNKNTPKKVLDYLFKRGITFDIINDYGIGFTSYSEDNKNVSNRIIIPSYDEFGELNYWTGRDFTSNPKRQRYYNPQVERKDIIFNENKIQWDADITIVEGPMDCIVTPNSVPLLGKSLSSDYKLYQSLVKKANAHINVFLDGDAFENIIKTYKVLDHGRLKGKIRYIKVDDNLDPSEIFQRYGYKGIIQALNQAQTLSEIYSV